MIYILNFRKIQLTDAPLLEPIFYALPYRLCDHCFSTLFIWQYKYAIRIAIQDGLVYLAYGYETDQMSYMAPFYPDERFTAAIHAIAIDAKHRQIPLRLSVINDPIRTHIETCMPDIFCFMPDRDNSDYLYLQESLASLKGKKLHSKRNFINRFTTEFQNRYQFEPISDANSLDILEFNSVWCQTSKSEHSTCVVNEESCALAAALANRERLKLAGLCLRLDGKVIACALGTKLCQDTFLQQIEKADASIPGAYPMITRAFALSCAQNFLYVNREEDLGIDGLRKAKLSFAPEYINLRYIATLKKEGSFPC